MHRGDIFEIKNGHEIYAMIPKHCIYAKSMFDWTPVREKVKVGDQLRGLDTSFLEGKYVVTRSEKDSSHDRFGNVWDNGLHIYASPIVKAKFSDAVANEIEIDFYVTGDNYCTNKDIKPIGQIKIKNMVVVVEDGESQ